MTNPSQPPTSPPDERHDDLDTTTALQRMTRGYAERAAERERRAARQDRDDA